MKKKSKTSHKAIKAFAIACILFMAHSLASGRSDSYIRERVVQLTSERGSCSGEQIHTANGGDYILTAAHCRILADKDGTMTVARENGSKLRRRVVAEDGASDLLLLEGLPGLKGLDIASHSRETQEVRTFTHGAALKTYKTEGVLVEDKQINVLIGAIIDDAGQAACEAGGAKMKSLDLGFLKACVMSVTETITTAMIVPGSSGGAVVDSSGSLVGVVSAGGDSLGALVRLSDIHAFLAGY